MNKKGIAEEGVWIALVVLVIVVGIFIVTPAYGSASSFFKNLVFGGDSGTQAQAEILRYDIEANDVFYYEGGSFKQLTDETYLNGKTFDNVAVTEAFKNYYYATPRTYFNRLFSEGNTADITYASPDGLQTGWENVFYPTTEGYPKLKARILFMTREPDQLAEDYGNMLTYPFAKLMSYFLNPSILEHERGDIGIALINTDETDTRVYGELILRNNNQLFFKGYGENEYKELKAERVSTGLGQSKIVDLSPGEELFISLVRAWSDSILKGGNDETPLKINYDLNGKEGEYNVEVERISGDLIARLNDAGNRESGMGEEVVSVEGYDYTRTLEGYVRPRLMHNGIDTGIFFDGDKDYIYSPDSIYVKDFGNENYYQLGVQPEPILVGKIVSGSIIILPGRVSLEPGEDTGSIKVVSQETWDALEGIDGMQIKNIPIVYSG